MTNVNGFGIGNGVVYFILSQSFLVTAVGSNGFMVPDGADLYVEARMPSRDVGYVKVGDEVRVKLEAYPFQRFGTLNGVLDVISADSVPMKQDDAQSQLVYPLQVRITDKLAGLAARGIRVRPGLVASAEVKTGKRSIAAYVLDPILRTTDESMREP